MYFIILKPNYYINLMVRVQNSLKWPKMAQNSLFFAKKALIGHYYAYEMIEMDSKLTIEMY